MIRSACLALTLVASATSFASVDSTALTTVAERSGFQKTGRYDEVIALCDGFRKRPIRSRCAASTSAPRRKAGR